MARSGQGKFRERVAQIEHACQITGVNRPEQPTRADDPTGIAQRILVLRGQRVLLDADLALLYGVSPKRLNEQVRRNRARFPEDFVFQLDIKELRSLRSQIATLEKGRGQHRKYPPLAFTEHGAASRKDATDRVHGGP